MRRAALLSVLVAGLLASPGRASAACSEHSPCLDAEPMWLAPGARYWSFISDPASLGPGDVAGALTVGFRLKPAVLVVPAPNAAGREINLILHTTDLTAGFRVGLGERMELTLLLPAGLYQRGAGIKGVTHQSAPPIAAQSLHDPRLGFGFALPVFRPLALASKLRLDFKLPLGDRESLMGEESPVVSPTVAIQMGRGPWLLGSELGARLRRPVNFFNRRIGSQAFFALGLGYELPRPRLAFTLEAYAARSLVSSAEHDLAAEWQAATRFTPQRWPRLSFGLSGGSNIPSKSESGPWQAGVGAPLLRALAFVRYAPP